jgi:putative oxidoreductase
MKNKIILAITIAISLSACVQKAFLKTVIITLTVKNKKDIKNVGIRGNGNPLSWDTDFPMEEVVKDSMYKATVTTMTAYTFGEIKFTIDGDWELKEKDNRKIVFNEKSDTTFYNAIFNQN